MRHLFSKNLIPLLILLFLVILLYIFDAPTHFTLEALKEKESIIFNWMRLHPFLSAFTLFCLYVVSTCLFIPAASILSLITGIIYPFPYALALSVFSETLGACLFFLVLRFALKPFKPWKKDSYYFKKAEEGFKKNPASYLLFLRFSHLTPTWLITISATLFKSSFWTFAWTTFLGTIPISYLIVEAGETLKKTHKASYLFKWDDILDTNTKLLFLGFAILALSPILIKKFIKY